MLIPLGLVVVLLMFARDRRRRGPVFWSLDLPMPDEPESQDFFFEGPDLMPEERLLVIEALRRHPKVSAMKQQLIRKFDTATRVNYAPIDWDKVQKAFDKNWDDLEAEARKQNVPVSDILFDRDRRDGEDRRKAA